MIQSPSSFPPHLSLGFVSHQHGSREKHKFFIESVAKVREDIHSSKVGEQPPLLEGKEGERREAKEQEGGERGKEG